MVAHAITQLVAIACARRDHVPELIALFGASPLRVVVVNIGRHLVPTLDRHAPDAVVLDHSGGEFDIGRVCRDLSESIDAPLVVVGAPHDVASHEWVADVLESGAHDVVDATMSARVVRARLRAAIRSAGPRARPSECIALGDVDIDVAARAVRAAGTPIDLPPRQFDLLVALGRHPNVVLSHAELLEAVWRLPPDSGSHRVRVAASVLRRLLGRAPRRPRVEAVAGIGYRLSVPA